MAARIQFRFPPAAGSAVAADMRRLRAQQSSRESLLASAAAKASGQRGAVLIVTLLIMAVLALALTSYVSLNLSSARMAQRGFQQAAAFNLAEAGAEEALWSFNQANAGSGNAWDDWTLASGTAKRRFTGFNLGSATGSVKVYVDNHTPTGNARPSVVALSTVEATGGASVSKMVEVTLRRRSRFSAGLMAKDTLTFAGNNVSVDSWNSDPDNNPATAPVPYSETTRNDRGSVASVAVEMRKVLINQADVYGYVYTGGATPEVGENGSIKGRNTPDDVRIDPARVATDFSANFPDVTAPADGFWLPWLPSSLGVPGRATKWRCPNLSLNGKQTLTIYGDVTLVLTGGPGTRTIDVTGQASILVTANSSLTVYSEGDLLIAGNGLANANIRPSTCLIYGTHTRSGGQRIQIAGNGALKAAIYAPNADITINGNGDIFGGAVGNTITLTGNAAFHYDESLENLDSGMPFGVDQWREITSGEARAAQMNKFNGW
jgi:Tfp pilus assembly protein PilX